MHPLCFHATPYAVLSCKGKPSRLLSQVVKEIMPGELIWNSVCKHLFLPDELQNGTGKQPSCLLRKGKRARMGLLLNDFILGEEPNLLHSILTYLPLCTLFNVYCWTYCFLLKLYLLPPSVMVWLCHPAAACCRSHGLSSALGRRGRFSCAGGWALWLGTWTWSSRSGGTAAGCRPTGMKWGCRESVCELHLSPDAVLSPKMPVWGQDGPRRGLT